MSNRVSTEKIEEFVVQVINTFDPEIATTPESAFYDLFIRFFNLTVLGEILRVLEVFESNQDFSNTQMTEQEYDVLLKRWFFTRKGGSTYNGTATLVFDNPNNVFTIRKSDQYIVNGFTFNPVTPRTILRVDYTKSNTSGVDEFSIDVPLQAVVAGSESSLFAGDTISLPYVSLTGLLRSYVSKDIVSGEDFETNDQALARLQESISVENLVNVKSISAIFAETFPGVISATEVVGYLEEEMFRDIVSTQIPSRIARMFFVEPIDFQITPTNTIFYYNMDTQVQYRSRDFFSILATDTDRWRLHPSGNYFFEVPLEILDVNKVSGYINDKPFDVLRNQGTLAFPNYINMVNLGIGYTTCVSSTEIYPIYNPIPTRSLISYGNAGFVSNVDPDVITQLGKFELVNYTDILIIQEEEYTITEIIASGDSIRVDRPIELPEGSTSSLFNWMLMRDTFTPTENTYVHVGGMTDIYLKVPTVRTVKTFQVPTNTSGVFPVPDEYKPILKVHSANTLSKEFINVFGLVNIQPELRFSAKDPADFAIDPGLIGTTVEIEFTHAPYIKTIDSFVTDKLNKITAENTLTKFLYPIFLTVLGEVEIGGTDRDANSLLVGAVTTYIETLSNQARLPVSKLIKALHSSVPDLKRVASLQVIAKQYMPDGDVITIAGDDIIEPVINLAMGVSPRTTQFLLETAEFIFV